MKSRQSGPKLMILVWLLSTLVLWTLAFFPTGSESPAWLDVARDVCFGTKKDGLPDASGWILLILGPLSFLLAAVIVWPQELKSIVRRNWHSHLGKTFVVFLLVIFAVEGLWAAKKIQASLEIENFNFQNQTEESLPAHYARTDKPASDFNLIDQSGHDIRLSDFKDDTVLLTFAFAHCQTVCPVLVRDALEVAEKVPVKGFRILIVTLDPWRDTPKSLPFLAKKWELPENAHVLSGTVPEVQAALRRFNVSSSRNENTGDVAHPALTYLIAPGGTIAYTFNNAPKKWLHEAIDRIKSHEITSSNAR